MPKDRFAGKKMRNRLAEQEYSSLAAFPFKKRKPRRVPTDKPKQTVAEFLAAGGKVTKLPAGVAFNGSGGVIKRGR